MTGAAVGGSPSLVALLGIEADKRLLDEDRFNLPEAEQHLEPAIPAHGHSRLVAAGSAMTAATLIGGVLLILYGAGRLLLDDGGALDAALGVLGALLAGTHWGWVHVAEYIGLTIDDRAQRAVDERRAAWLADIAPYPRFSVSTSVLDDASTRIERVRHRPVLTARDTFTFVRETDAEQTYDADTPAEVIAAAVETMRRRARLENDRLAERWEAASTAYAAALSSSADDEQRLAAKRAAARALSEHINASLLDPPLVE